MAFSAGDKIEVIDDGLAMLRKLCPDMPPNHYGCVERTQGRLVFVLFDDTKQTAPYPEHLVKLRAKPCPSIP